MRLKSFATLILLAILWTCLPSLAGESKKTAKFEIQLVWGTDDAKSPDANHKPVDPDVEKRLKTLPLKFKNYFLVRKQIENIAIGQTAKVPLSERCAVEIKNLDNLRFEVTFFGRGKQTAKRTQDFPKGEMLLQGGNAPNATAWLAVLKRTD